MSSLKQRIKTCQRCPGLNIPGVTEAAPGYGNLNSPIVIIGQSLCGPCMTTQIPFTGGSGRIIDKAIQLAGLSKHDLFITNVVHCHPPDNRTSKPEEISNCSEYLQIELQIVQPRLIIAVGKDATQWIEKCCPKKVVLCMDNLKIEQLSSEHVAVINIPHPSFMLRQPLQKRHEYIVELAAALQWGYSGVLKGKQK